jgi:hypothetical protein
MERLREPTGNSAEASLLRQIVRYANSIALIEAPGYRLDRRTSGTVLDILPRGGRRTLESADETFAHGVDGEAGWIDISGDDLVLATGGNLSWAGPGAANEMVKRPHIAMFSAGCELMSWAAMPVDDFSFGTPTSWGIRNAIWHPVTDHPGYILAAGEFVTMNGLDQKRMVLFNGLTGAVIWAAQAVYYGTSPTFTETGYFWGPMCIINNATAVLNGFLTKYGTMECDGGIIAVDIDDGTPVAAFDGQPGLFYANQFADYSTDTFYAAAQGSPGVRKFTISGAVITQDATFDTAIGTGFNTGCNSIVVNTAIYVCGGFNSYDGDTVNTVAKLALDGTLDATYATNVGTGANAAPTRIVDAGSGKVYVVGSFTSWNGSSAVYIVRLNSDGTRDTGFTSPFTGSGANVNAIGVQSDGNIVVSGLFTSAGGKTRYKLARLSPTGAVLGP